MKSKKKNPKPLKYIKLKFSEASLCLKQEFQ